MSVTEELIDGSWDRKCRLGWWASTRGRGSTLLCAMLWKSNPEEMGTLGGAEKVAPASEAGLGGEEGS